MSPGQCPECSVEMDWKYQEILQGNSHIAYLMAGDRVVCRLKQCPVDVNDPGEDVERTRREFQSIVERHNETRRNP